MLYFLDTMKKLVRAALVLGMCLGLALLSGAVRSSPRSAMQGQPTPTAVSTQLTTTPQPLDASEIGSTDGIVAMGGIIVLIVLTPILLRRKQWMRSAQQQDTVPLPQRESQ